MRYALLMALVLLQGCSELLFYPEKGLPFTPTIAGLKYQDEYLTAADGTRLNAWWLPAKAGSEVKGTILYLHGNGGNMAMHLGAPWWLPEQGYQVLMLDYRGYGLSAGEPSLPALYEDIDAAFSRLSSDAAVKGKPVYVLAQSLGGAIAVHYLAEHPQQAHTLDALIIDGTPASYRDVAQSVLATSWLTWPLQVPLSWFVPDGDSAITAIPKLKGLPLLIYHSIDDAVVPVANGLALYQAAPAPRVLQLTRGAHVQTFNDPTWRQVMLMFMSDPQSFTGLRRLAEVPNLESPQ